MVRAQGVVDGRLAVVEPGGRDDESARSRAVETDDGLCAVAVGQGAQRQQREAVCRRERMGARVEVRVGRQCLRQTGRPNPLERRGDDGRLRQVDGLVRDELGEALGQPDGDAARRRGPDRHMGQLVGHDDVATVGTQRAPRSGHEDDPVGPGIAPPGSADRPWRPPPPRGRPAERPSSRAASASVAGATQTAGLRLPPHGGDTRLGRARATHDLLDTVAGADARARARCADLRTTRPGRSQGCGRPDGAEAVMTRSAGRAGSALKVRSRSKDRGRRVEAEKPVGEARLHVPLDRGPARGRERERSSRAPDEAQVTGPHRSHALEDGGLGGAQAAGRGPAAARASQPVSSRRSTSATRACEHRRHRARSGRRPLPGVDVGRRGPRERGRARRRRRGTRVRREPTGATAGGAGTQAQGGGRTRPLQRSPEGRHDGSGCAPRHRVMGPGGRPRVTTSVRRPGGLGGATRRSTGSSSARAAFAVPVETSPAARKADTARRSARSSGAVTTSPRSTSRRDAAGRSGISFSAVTMQSAQWTSRTGQVWQSTSIISVQPFVSHCDLS